jgi:hypothetical protein
MNDREVRKELESRVLQAIEQGKTTSASIMHATWLVERAVDSTLQRLRKAGKIEYVSPVQGWRTKKEKVEVVRDLLVGPSNEEKLALKKVLADHIEYRGWNHASIALGYLIGLGFSALKANQLQCELLKEFRRG